VQAVKGGPCNSEISGKVDTVTDVDPGIIPLYIATVLPKSFH
jgi:hypothetical protein